MHNRGLRVALVLMLAFLALLVGERGLRGGRSAVVRAGGSIRYVATDGEDSGDCSNSTQPCRTVQYAVDRTLPGDEVRIATGVYTGVQTRPAWPGYPGSEVVTQVVYISRAVTLRGGYTPTDWSTSDPDAHPTTLDAEGAGRVLYVLSDGDVTVEGLRFVNGRSSTWSGGIYADLSNVRLTMRDCAVMSNTAQGNGGGLYADLGGGGELVLEGNTFAHNSASSGGGLLVADGILTMTHNVVRENVVASDSPAQGGGAYLNRCTAYVAANTFEANRSGDSGGGMEATWGDIVLTGNVFRDNVGGVHGGGGFSNGGIDSGHAYTITDNLFQGNTLDADGYTRGGGVRIANGADGWVLFEGNRLLDNVAATGPTDIDGGRGGGLYIRGPARVADNLFQNNWGCSAARYGGYGGGLFVAEGSLLIEGNRFFDNRAARQAGDDYDTEALGGAVFVHAGSVVTMINNAFVGNVGSEESLLGASPRYGGGGAVAARGAPSAMDTSLTVLHNTFADNQSAAFQLDSGVMSTMSHNLFSGHDTDVLNVHPSAAYSCPTTTLDYTLWWPTQEVEVWPAGNSCAPPTTAHDFVGDPAFVDDYHIGQNSAALDRGPGVGVTRDIDGHPRPLGAGYDLGADEYTGVDLSASSKIAEPDRAAAGEVVTFTLVLRNGGNTDSTATRLYDPIPTATTYVSGSAAATAGTLDDVGGITWQGSVGSGASVTLTFRVTVEQEVIIQNVATLTDTYGTVYALSAWINRPRIYLPLVLRQ